MKTRNFTLLISLIILFWSCNGSYKNESYAAEEEAAAMVDEMFEGLEEATEEAAPIINANQSRKTSTSMDSEDNDGNGESVKTKRKLIKTGDIEFETSSLENTNKEIKSIVKNLDGYISNESEQKYYDQISQTLELRIPAKNFDQMLGEISKGVEHFDRKNIHVKDVTEEFVDIQARLKTKKELEKRYLQLLSKANNVGEILEIEREIGSLRADIESFEGRLKYLKDQVSFSTLEVKFYEMKEVVSKNRFGQKFKDGFGNGWDNLIYFFIGLTNIWPFVLAIIIVIYFIRRKLKNRRRKKLEK